MSDEIGTVGSSCSEDGSAGGGGKIPAFHQQFQMVVVLTSFHMYDLSHSHCFELVNGVYSMLDGVISAL